MRLTGKGFDFSMGTLVIHAKSISLSITDNSSVAETNGVPDGTVDGSVSAEGELELDTRNLKKVLELARAGGSFRGIPPQDFVWYGQTATASESLKVESFGNALAISDLLNIDPSGGDVLTHKIKYKVTSPDFVKIDGIPYLSAHDTRGLIG